MNLLNGSEVPLTQTSALPPSVFRPSGRGDPNWVATSTIVGESWGPWAWVAAVQKAVMQLYSRHSCGTAHRRRRRGRWAPRLGRPSQCRGGPINTSHDSGRKGHWTRDCRCTQE